MFDMKSVTQQVLIVDGWKPDTNSQQVSIREVSEPEPKLLALTQIAKPDCTSQVLIGEASAC